MMIALKTTKFLSIMACAFLIASCCHKSDSDSGNKVVSLSEKYETELLSTNQNTDWEGYLITKYRTSDGYVIEDSMQYGPINRAVRVTDPKGRLFAVGGIASECVFYSCVKFLYGENDEVIGLLSLPYVYGTVDDHLVDEALDSNIIEDWHMSIDAFYFLAFEAENDGLYFSRYYFRRDSAGRIDKVYDPILYQSIAAPSGHHIEYEVRKDEDFWSSDINGGWYDVIFRTVPNDPEETNPIRKTYYGYRERK